MTQNINPSSAQNPTVTLLFFARIGEILGRQNEVLELNNSITTVANLVDFLSNRGELWTKTLHDSNIKVAVNHTISSSKQSIEAGDEIAFLPPVTGG